MSRDKIIVKNYMDKRKYLKDHFTYNKPRIVWSLKIVEALTLTQREAHEIVGMHTGNLSIVKREYREG